MKHCKDCVHAKVKLITNNKTGQELLESSTELFVDARVVNIRCELGILGKEYSSMRVFETSYIPVQAAEQCPSYEED